MGSSGTGGTRFSEAPTGTPGWSLAMVARPVMRQPMRLTPQRGDADMPDWEAEAERLADALARIAACEFHGDLEHIGFARRVLLRTEQTVGGEGSEA